MAIAASGRYCYASARGIHMQERDTGNDPGSPPGNSEDVWTYRGYRLSPGDFVTSMVHFYRGEVSRSNTWRMRIDATTNWAVVTTAAILTFAFSAAEHSHAVILLGLLLIGLFLVIEARRYRYYELSALRVRLMETDFFATMLKPPFSPHEEWAARVVDTLLTPQFPISFWEAIGRRLRRNFIWIYSIFGLAWVLKLLLYPTESYSIGILFQHARLGFIPGEAVVAMMVFFYACVFAVALFTSGLRASPGEVLSHEQVLGGDILRGLAKAAAEIPFGLRREQLVIIITEKASTVSEQLLTVLKRGVTGLQGTGMYTGTARSVLFCAVSPSELSRVKAVVYEADPNAFLVVNPTQEVLGGGFGDLRPKWKKKMKDERPAGTDEAD